MEVKIQNRVTEIEVSTDLSPKDLKGLDAQMAPLGAAGTKVLKIIRELANAVATIEGAACDLKLIALAAQDGALDFSVTFAARSPGYPYESVAHIPPNLKSQTPISELEVSVRAKKTLLRLGVETVGQLSNYDADDIGHTKCCGPVTVQELRVKAAAYGVKFKGE